MEFIKVDDWIPSDGIILEDSALKAIKHQGNVSVMAGPGAGKTELLAQKAGFLFETGECNAPHKILAISFKVDAAKNLEERVKKRYGKDNSIRFESKTFDSFAKSILDQFISAVPSEYRPQRSYDIVLSEREINTIIKSYLLEPNSHYPKWQYEYSEPVFNKKFIEEILPLEPIESDLYSWLVDKSWKLLVKGTSSLNSSLTFPMISIIVEYLLRSNPLLVKSLRATYTHVFLDEFQDTTNIQYNLLKTLFSNSNVSITAVGDEKQRIMGWAGAISNAFRVFKEDFNSEEYTLRNNFRSAPKLVRIQNLFSQTISENPSTVESIGNWSEEDGLCELWMSSSHIDEGEVIASTILQWMNSDNLNPRDFCIIVKQQEHIYAKAIMKSLDKLGINSRLEKEYQDLLSDECVEAIIAIVELSFSAKKPELWLKTMEWLINIKGKKIGNEDILFLNNLENSLASFTQEIEEKLRMINLDTFEDELRIIFEEILEFINLNDLKAFYPKYKQKNYVNQNLKKVIEKIALSFKKHFDWREAIKDFYGEFSIPIMTIHKSKGLEYNTVIFVGLEDNAFWSFKSQTESDKKAFFVALSRAKERIIFTFSESREVLNFGKLAIKKQSMSNISEVYDLLTLAGVPVKNKSKVKSDYALLRFIETTGSIDYTGTNKK
jgi:DNA helicase-2/ATP-dependent DNA helicase PcrA